MPAWLLNMTHFLKILINHLAKWMSVNNQHKNIILETSAGRPKESQGCLMGGKQDSCFQNTNFHGTSLKQVHTGWIGDTVSPKTLTCPRLISGFRPCLGDLCSTKRVQHITNCVGVPSQSPQSLPVSSEASTANSGTADCTNSRCWVTCQSSDCVLCPFLHDWIDKWVGELYLLSPRETLSWTEGYGKYSILELFL